MNSEIIFASSIFALAASTLGCRAHVNPVFRAPLLGIKSAYVTGKSVKGLEAYARLVGVHARRPETNRASRIHRQVGTQRDIYKPTAHRSRAQAESRLLQILDGASTSARFSHFTLESDNAISQPLMDLAVHGGFSVSSQPNIKNVSIEQFKHGGNLIRGLGALRDFNAGDLIATIPRSAVVASSDLTAKRFGMANALGRVGLWLAETKLQLADHAPEGLETWVRTLPSLDELQSVLLMRRHTLDTWVDVPKISPLKHFVDSSLTQLEKDLRHYNAARGDRPRIRWSTALWGLVVAQSIAFDMAKHCFLIPIAGFVNHGGSDSNAQLGCDSIDDGPIRIRATRPIEQGSEILFDYGVDDLPFWSSNQISYVGKYGFFDDTRLELWTSSDCERLVSIGFGVGNMHSDAMERLIDELVSASCADVVKDSTLTVES